MVVTAPKLISQKFLEKTLQENSQWIEERLNKKKTFQVPTDEKEIRRAKKKARKVIEEKLDFFNQYYQFSFTTISIRNQKTRWGSCSSTGSLNFNYKLIYLSEKLLDYVVVHELCHLWEMNHSVNFWNLVAKRIPDFKERRKDLKKVRI
ncbi:MAG: M48 family metallopeptidase [Candidatus Moranbacteria bacterium]|nr:M48 family metallopeptidase [Candidatus Moranbacteria bacterium]